MQIYGLQVMDPQWVLLAAPPEKISMQPGQTLRVHLSFNYKYWGAEPVTVALHGFIGTRQADGAHSDDRGKEVLHLYGGYRAYYHQNQKHIKYHIPLISKISRISTPMRHQLKYVGRMPLCKRFNASVKPRVDLRPTS